MTLPEQTGDDQDGDQAFEHVAGKNNHPCFGTHHAQGVRRAGVAAAVIPDVDPLFLSDQISRLKVPENITNQ